MLALADRNCATAFPHVDALFRRKGTWEVLAQRFYLGTPVHLLFRLHPDGVISTRVQTHCPHRCILQRRWSRYTRPRRFCGLLSVTADLQMAWIDDSTHCSNADITSRRSCCATCSHLRGLFAHRDWNWFASGAHLCKVFCCLQRRQIEPVSIF